MNTSCEDDNLLLGRLFGLRGVGNRELIAAVACDCPAEELAEANLGLNWVFLYIPEVVHQVCVRVRPAIRKVHNIAALHELMLKLQRVKFPIAILSLY